MALPDFISRHPVSRGMVPAVFLTTCGLLTAQPAEDAGDIRPPKDLVEIPQPEVFPVGLWLAVGGVVLALGIAVLLWKRHARGRKPKSPPEIALAALAELETGGAALSAEAFANRAAQTVREYIAGRFGLAAPRRTTEEFLREVETAPLAGEGDHLRVFLKSCDLAKFAGSHLDSSQRTELVQAARGFVTATASSQEVKS